MNQLLIVTCNRDTWLFRHQCQSIGQYLETCTVNIFINELNSAEWKKWFDVECKPYLVNHNVTLYTYNDFVDCIAMENLLQKFLLRAGWITQQIFKLAFSLKTSAPYIVLDSKNWFIKHTKLADIQKRRRRRVAELFHNFYFDAIEKLKATEIYYCRPEITPYNIDPIVVNELFNEFGGVDNFIKWFVLHETPSEFIMYDLCAQCMNLDSDVGQDSLYTKHFWGDEVTLDLTQFKQTLANPMTHMVSIHPKLVENLNKSHIEALLNTECSKNLS